MKDILYWILIWYLVWGIYNFYFRWAWEKFKSKKFIPRGLFFLASFFIVYYFFKNLLNPFMLHLTISFIVMNLIGLTLSLNKTYYHNFSKDRLFILFQSFNIIYQQASVVVGLVLIKSLVTSYSDIYFGIFFGIVHLPLLFFKWVRLKYQVLVACFVIGCVFSFLINNFQYGVLISSLLHYLFYAWQIHYLKDEEKI